MRVSYDQLTDEQIRNADVIAVIDSQSGAGKTVYNGPVRFRQHGTGPHAIQVVEVELADKDARYQDLCQRVAAVKKMQLDESASELARKHYEVEPGLTRVIHFSGAPTLELPTDGTIKLLEVNTNTVPSGVMPLGFGPAPEAGIRFPSIIIEVTPDEFDKIQANELPLPKGWEYKQREIPRPTEAVSST
jgi:hypothetical protein